jgi:hypothetical protein
MHTDSTLRIFEEVTTSIGAEFRAFVKNTCPAFDTKELKRETDARHRRRSKKAKAREQPMPNDESTLNAQSTSMLAPDERAPTSDSAANRRQKDPRRKKFNMRIYKYQTIQWNFPYHTGYPA